MIKIICPSCGFSKDINEGSIPENAASVVCPVCRESFGFPAFHKRKAGIAARVLAVIIDILLLNAFNLIVSFVLDTALSKTFQAAGTDDDFSYTLVGGIIYFVWIASMFIYFTVATHRCGKTVGKKILGIKVVSEDGGLPTFGQSFKREVPGKILSSITLGAGFLWAIFDKNHQALHDKIAKTYVVYV